MSKKWPKYRQNIEKYREIVKKLPFFCCISVVSVPQENFFMSYWYRVDFWPKNDSRIGIRSKKFEIFFYYIGLEMDFLAKNLGYWYWVNLAKIQNAAL